MTAPNSATTVSTINKLRNLFHFTSNPEKLFFSLRFHVTAPYEKSKLVANWIANQHQFKSKNIFEFLNDIWLLTSVLPLLPFWSTSIFEVVLNIIEHARTTIEGTLTRFENLPICLCSYNSNTLKILHS